MKKKLTKEKVKCLKWLKQKYLKSLLYLKDRLNTKSHKSVFVKNTITTHIIKHCKGEKKRGVKKIGGFRKKLFIPDYQIYESIEHKVKSKIGTIFVNEDILEEYSSKIYETDLYFSENYEKNTSW